MKRFMLGLMVAISVFFAFGAASTPAQAQVSEKSITYWQSALGDPNNCWGCDLYKKMAQVTLEVGERGEAVFASSAISAINAFMGLWVVWQLYLLLSPSHANGPAQTIDTIFQRLVIMMIILAILKVGAYTFIMEDLVFPAFDGVMASSMLILDGAGSSCASGSGLVEGGARLICSMHVEMGKGIGLGLFLMSSAQFTFWPGGEFQILQFVGGVVIAICFAWMLIMLPFRLFDAMIRIAIVSVILPVVVLAYQFKPTRGICKQAATSTLAAALTFLFTAVAVAISTKLLSLVASPVISSVSGASNANGDIGPLTGGDFMIIVAAACGMAAFIKQAGTIAGEFAGFQGSMGNVGGAGAAGFAAGVSGAAAGAAFATGYGAKKGVAMMQGAAKSSGAGGGGGGGSAPAAPGTANISR